MIGTMIANGNKPLLVQRFSGVTDHTDVERATTSALQGIEQLLIEHPTFDLLLDLRDLHFSDLRAHQAWRIGFLSHPLILQHARGVAVIGNDTPAFRAEQQHLETSRCHFFVELAAGQAWLEMFTSVNRIRSKGC